VTCANCGDTNPARARFCLTCGSPLAPPGRRRGVRKVVTAVVGDVHDPTALGERQANALLDPAGVPHLGGRADQAAPLLREALALSARKGNLVTRDRAGALLAGRTDA
jgi:hypothetical protein